MNASIFFVGLVIFGYGLKHGAAKVTLEETNAKMVYGLCAGVLIMALAAAGYFFGPFAIPSPGAMLFLGVITLLATALMWAAQKKTTTFTRRRNSFGIVLGLLLVVAYFNPLSAKVFALAIGAKAGPPALDFLDRHLAGRPSLPTPLRDFITNVFAGMFAFSALVELVRGFFR